jgi:NhaP-type Na+/H+ and K+/H+ antiporter
MLDFFITAAAAQSAMKPSPIGFDQLIPTLIMVMIAMIGGLVNWIRKVQLGLSRAFNIAELIGELFISAATGAITYWLLKGFEVNEYLVAAGVGIAGHMGSRVWFLGEQLIEKKARKLVD